MLGKLAPFEVRFRNGCIILQKGKAITLFRLKEIAAAQSEKLEWSVTDLSEDSLLLDKLLNWREDGGATDWDFKTYRRHEPPRLPTDASLW